MAQMLRELEILCKFDFRKNSITAGIHRVIRTDRQQIVEFAKEMKWGIDYDDLKGWMQLIPPESSGISRITVFYADEDE
jgi:hypothetical protein